MLGAPLWTVTSRTTPSRRWMQSGRHLQRNCAGRISRLRIAIDFATLRRERRAQAQPSRSAVGVTRHAQELAATAEKKRILPPSKTMRFEFFRRGGCSRRL
jgi:hypothetical protein